MKLIIFALFINTVHANQILTENKPLLQCNSILRDGIDEPLWRGFNFMDRTGTNNSNWKGGISTNNSHYTKEQKTTSGIRDTIWVVINNAK